MYLSFTPKFISRVRIPVIDLYVLYISPRAYAIPVKLIPCTKTHSSCVLCPKAGPVDDDAIWSGAQLFSSTPRS